MTVTLYGLNRSHVRVAAQRKELNDESYRRMDEWLDGRRDVDLDSDRRPRGGPPGRSDYPAVQ